ncbi:MAG: nucleoside hydrolase [Kiritimatiellae bacterium]|nr:nucleoside hydrolase [Kiritimatiellia bacterium]
MKNIILDTDWGGDCDDVVAARLLANAHKSGEINFIGCIINDCRPYSVRSLDAFLLLSGIDIPIGMDFNAKDFDDEGAYQKRMVDNFKSKYATETDAEPAVRAYRRMLATSSDKVEIVAIGFTQVLADLLESEADDISPLNGMELVKEKVAHLWDMGGRWDGVNPREYNFVANARSISGAHRMCANWPTPITFLGWEVGDSVHTGGNIPEDDPLRKALIDYRCEGGRSSWDPMTALLAVVGDPEKAGYRTVCGRAFAEKGTGICSFVEDANGPHRYVVKLHPDAWYEEQINTRLPL